MYFKNDKLHYDKYLNSLLKNIHFKCTYPIKIMDVGYL